MLNLRDHFLKSSLDQHSCLQTLGTDSFKCAMTTFLQHFMCRVGKEIVWPKKFTALEAQPANMA